MVIGQVGDHGEDVHRLAGQVQDTGQDHVPILSLHLMEQIVWVRHKKTRCATQTLVPQVSFLKTTTMPTHVKICII